MFVAWFFFSHTAVYVSAVTHFIDQDELLPETKKAQGKDEAEVPHQCPTSRTVLPTLIKCRKEKAVSPFSLKSITHMDGDNELCKQLRVGS